ncbi:glutamate ABC transporter substrate-binding protein [Microbacterium sp.]|uniref:glutamate ABC transporter substrate-binding protein n=1 Tax=Microbacterium sp. TaxID=51671 RepID=UPI0039E58207
MRKTRLIAALSLAAAAAVALTGCNSGTPGAETSVVAPDEETVWFTVADPKPEVADSPTVAAITERGTVKVGVKEDQPNLGYLDPTTGERSGFDVDIARWVAASLGYDEEDIEFTAIDSANREQSIINGDIDYYVGTYSITDKRKEQISFAGPYFVTGQGLLVAADSDITGKDDLTADTVVCSVTGSTSIERIKTETEAEPVELSKYSECVDQLKNGQVDAVTTDEAILIGYAAQDPDNLKVVGEPFSEERYGIGIKKDDTAFVEFVNTMLTDGGDIWTAIFEKNLGAAGVEGTQPEVDPVG